MKLWIIVICPVKKISFLQKLGEIPAWIPGVIVLLFAVAFFLPQQPSANTASVAESVDEKIEKLAAASNDENYIFDLQKKYIAVVKGSLGDEDYSLQIKEIDSGKLVYQITLRQITTQYPKVYGDILIHAWIAGPNGFLRTEITEGKRLVATLNVKSDTWETEILPTPDNYRGGVERAGTIDGGYLAYTDQTVWTGIDVVYEAVMEKQLAEGKPKNLFVANLRTGEIRTIESVPLEEAHRFNLKWNGSTLSYTMPDGTVKSYTPPF